MIESKLDKVENLARDTEVIHKLVRRVIHLQ